MIKIIVTASLSSFFFGLFGVSWESVDRKIEREFPDVEHISTDQMQSQYQPVGRVDLAVIDVRAADEFRVSHLDKAVNLETSEDIAAQFANKDAPIVVYCSVGYRSAAVAQELEEMGYTNVLNLRHSIFEWASKDYPLVNATGETDKVHPFNRAWGELVDQSLHQYSP